MWDLTSPYGCLGYIGFGQHKFTITGYRFEAQHAINASKASYRLTMLKIQDNGNNKMEIIPFEDIEIYSDALKLSPIMSEVPPSKIDHTLLNCIMAWT